MDLVGIFGIHMLTHGQFFRGWQTVCSWQLLQSGTFSPRRMGATFLIQSVSWGNLLPGHTHALPALLLYVSLFWSLMCCASRLTVETLIKSKKQQLFKCLVACFKPHTSPANYRGLVVKPPSLVCLNARFLGSWNWTLFDRHWYGKSTIWEWNDSFHLPFCSDLPPLPQPPLPQGVTESL